VIVAWVFFRANSAGSAVTILLGMAWQNGVSMPLLLPKFWFFTHQGTTPMSNVNSTFACIAILIAAGIALLLPNLYDMTRGYEMALISGRQFVVRRMELVILPVSYSISWYWCVFVGIVAVIAIISVQTTSEFLYFQF
jgi:hypothetical protein